MKIQSKILSNKLIKKAKLSVVDFPIRRRIKYGLLILTFSVISLGCILLYMSYKTQKEQQKILHSERSYITANKIDMFLNDLIRKLEYFTKLENFSSYSHDLRKQLLLALIKENRAFERISIVDIKGDEILYVNSSTSNDLRNSFFSNTIQKSIRLQSKVYSEVLYEKTNQKPYMIAAFPIIKDNGEVGEVLVGKINLHFLDYIIDKCNVGRTGYICILDKNNRIISISNQHKNSLYKKYCLPEKIDYNSKPKTYRGFLNKQVVGSTSISKLLRWRVVLEMPVVEAYNPIFRMIAFMLIHFGISMVIAFAFSVIISKRISEPMTNIVEACNQISKNNLRVRISHNRKDEFGILTETINSMASNLQNLVDQYRTSKERYKYVFNNAGVALWIADYSKVKLKIAQLKGNGITDLESYINQHPNFLLKMREKIRYFDANKAAVKLFKAKAKHNLLSSLDKITSNQDLSIIKDEILAISRGEEFLQREAVNHTLDGEIIHLLISFYLPDSLEDSKQTLVSMMDITAIKKIKQELASEKDRLDVTLRSIGDGVITTDIDGNIVMLNAVAEKLTGWKQSEAQGISVEKVFNIVNEKTLLKVDNPVEKVLTTGKNVDLANHTMLISKSGERYSIADSGAPIKYDENNIVGAVLVFRDITDKLKMEAEAIKIEKLEALGLLAGGIAHDFNNILTAILGNISFANIMLKDQGIEMDMLKESEKAINRATKLTNQLLTFSKGGTPILQSSSITDIIDESVSLILRGTSISPVIEVDEGIWPAEIDPGQIHQVINNIILNAKQAMQNQGSLKICAMNKIIQDFSGLPLAKGNYIHILIKDEGCGISEELIGKIFDPFFTTKEKGNGLGLASAYSIIIRHNGYIKVDSEIGKGSTFHIYLPASKRNEAILSNINEHSVVKGNGSVLIMDDEKTILHMISRFLNKIGYESDTAEHGDEVLKKYNQRLIEGKPYDVVIMDLTIRGGKGGCATIKELLEIHPEAVAIVSSGYSNDPVMADYQKYGFKGVIKKPYQLKHLSKYLHQIKKEHFL